MRRQNVIKNLLHELRRDEEILFVAPKCTWNFIYVFLIFLAFALLLTSVAPIVFTDIFEYFKDYSFRDFDSYDLNRIAAFLFFSLFFAVPWFLVIFSVVSFFKNELIITSQRLIYLNLGKIKTFERNEIKNIYSDYLCDRYLIRSVVISTRRENLEEVGKPPTLWNLFNNVQTHSFTFYNHEEIKKMLEQKVIYEEDGF